MSSVYKHCSRAFLTAVFEVKSNTLSSSNRSIVFRAYYSSSSSEGFAVLTQQMLFVCIMLFFRNVLVAFRCGPFFTHSRPSRRIPKHERQGIQKEECNNTEGIPLRYVSVQVVGVSGNLSLIPYGIPYGKGLTYRSVTWPSFLRSRTRSESLCRLLLYSNHCKTHLDRLVYTTQGGSGSSLPFYVTPGPPSALPEQK